MSDRPFRRYHVSEVCHRGGFLLAFAAFQKCCSDWSPGRSAQGRHTLQARRSANTAGSWLARGSEVLLAECLSPPLRPQPRPEAITTAPASAKVNPRGTPRMSTCGRRSEVAGGRSETRLPPNQTSISKRKRDTLRSRGVFNRDRGEPERWSKKVF